MESLFIRHSGLMIKVSRRKKATRKRPKTRKFPFFPQEANSSPFFRVFYRRRPLDGREPKNSGNWDELLFH